MSAALSPPPRTAPPALVAVAELATLAALFGDPSDVARTAEAHRLLAW